MKKLFKSKFVAQYGTIFVLLLLCVFFSLATVSERYPATNANTGRQLARRILTQYGPQPRVLIVIRPSDALAFANAIRQELEAGDAEVVEIVQGDPKDVRQALQRIGQSGSKLDVIVTHSVISKWIVLTGETLQQLGTQYASLSKVQVVTPVSYKWPTFLTRGNLLSVLNTIAVTAIVAIGMTVVIITAGIDLSVGSLIALSGVVAAWSMRFIADLSPGAELSVARLFVCCLAAIAVCGLMGAFSGTMVTLFNIPSFIVTLAFMQIARGLAFKLAGGPTPIRIQSETFHQLGAGDVFGIPIPVVLMALLYLLAYVLMSHTTMGRYIYAVGGNCEAARLSGVPVKRVLLFVYVVCGALAGLGGVIEAALFVVGNPNSSIGLELRIIAAVVVGGTSLAGGEGKILGTLVGALILAVISNGMYLTKVDAYMQMVVFGILILAAVLLDQLKRDNWRLAKRLLREIGEWMRVIGEGMQLIGKWIIARIRS